MSDISNEDRRFRVWVDVRVNAGEDAEDICDRMVTSHIPGRMVDYGFEESDALLPGVLPHQRKGLGE